MNLVSVSFYMRVYSLCLSRVSGVWFLSWVTGAKSLPGGCNTSVSGSRCSPRTSTVSVACYCWFCRYVFMLHEGTCWRAVCCILLGDADWWLKGSLQGQLFTTDTLTRQIRFALRGTPWNRYAVTQKYQNILTANRHLGIIRFNPIFLLYKNE